MGVVLPTDCGLGYGGGSRHGCPSLRSSSVVISSDCLSIVGAFGSDFISTDCLSIVELGTDFKEWTARQPSVKLLHNDDDGRKQKQQQQWRYHSW